jgi:hypothetical protein
MKTGSQKGVEIHYKDFRGSEMLDIRMPSSAPPRGKKVRPTPADKKDHVDRHESQGIRRYGVSRSVCFLIGGLVIVLSAIAWYFVLRFLLHR